EISVPVEVGYFHAYSGTRGQHRLVISVESDRGVPEDHNLGIEIVREQHVYPSIVVEVSNGVEANTANGQHLPVCCAEPCRTAVVYMCGFQRGRPFAYDNVQIAVFVKVRSPS